MNLKDYDMKDEKDVNKLISDLDKKIEELEQKEYDGITEIEQIKLKDKWDKEREKQEQELKRQFEKFEKEREELKKRERELIPVEDIKKGLNEMIKELDDKWNETLQSAIKDLCKGKTEEEKEEIMKSFEKSFMK